MAKCRAIKGDGTACKADAMAPSPWCYSHDPAHADTRARHARAGGKAGGRGRPAVELNALKALLAELIDEARDPPGDGAPALDTGRVYLINTLINTQLRVLEAERKLKELDVLDEHAARLAAVEEALNSAPRGGRAWG